MASIYRQLFCAISLAYAFCVCAQTTDPYKGVTTVEVFANSAMVITPPQAPPFQLKVYRLDSISRVQGMLNQGLPKTETEARAYMAKNQATIRRQIEPVILESSQGLMLAQKYRLEKIPAIVVNQRTVVFGETNVDRALMQYQAHRLKTDGK